MFHRLIVFVMLALLIPAPATPQLGGAVWCLNCSTEITQLLNKIQLIQQLIQQVEMLKDMAHQALTTRPSFGQAAGELNVLAQISQMGQGLGYSLQRLDQQYATRFPGYRAPLMNAQGGGTWAGQYSLWSTTALNTIAGSMGVASASNNYQSKSMFGIISSLRGELIGADSRNAEMQVMGGIADQTNEQLQHLRALALADMQSKAAFESYSIQKDAATEAAGQQYFNLAQPISDHVAPTTTNLPVGR